MQVDRQRRKRPVSAPSHARNVRAGDVAGEVWSSRITRVARNRFFRENERPLNRCGAGQGHAATFVRLRAVRIDTDQHRMSTGCCAGAPIMVQQPAKAPAAEEGDPCAKTIRTTAKACLAIAAGAILTAIPAQAQTKNPSGPLKLVVPFAAGGVADASSRLVMEKMGERLGQRVVIENVPALAAFQAARNVLNAPADGQTLALLTNGTAISVALFKQLPFDPVNHSSRSLPSASSKSFPLHRRIVAYKTLADVLKASKDKPGSLNIGTIVAGSTQHLTSELFRSSAGIDIKHVPFKANARPAAVHHAQRRRADGRGAGAREVESRTTARCSRWRSRADALPRPARCADSRGSRRAGLRRRLVERGLCEGRNARRDRQDAQQRHARSARRQGTQRQAAESRRRRPRATTPEEIGKRMKEDIVKWSAVIEKAGIEKR